jgi:hypothetical protein
MLAKMETIAKHLLGEPLAPGELMDESRKAAGLAAFGSRLAADCVEELAALSAEYETIRRSMPASANRTNLMTLLVGRAQILSGGEGGFRLSQSH